MESYPFTYQRDSVSTGTPDPEGALRERLRLAIAKATGTFDDIDLLVIVGRSPVGGIRYTGEKEQLQEEEIVRTLQIASSPRTHSFLDTFGSSTVWFGDAEVLEGSSGSLLKRSE